MKEYNYENKNNYGRRNKKSKERFVENGSCSRNLFNCLRHTINGKILIQNLTIMLKLQVIGNLGADAEFKSSNGKEFLTFRVADTRKYPDADGVLVEVTTWIGCIMDRPSNSLSKYLTKGTKVYVEGLPRFRTYKATKNGTTDYFVSVDLSVNYIQLCGGNTDDKDRPF